MSWLGISDNVVVNTHHIKAIAPMEGGGTKVWVDLENNTFDYPGYLISSMDFDTLRQILMAREAQASEKVDQMLRAVSTTAKSSFTHVP